MIPGWVLLLVSAGYVCLLFAVAYAGAVNEEIKDLFAAGADVVNDPSGLRDPEMAEAAASVSALISAFFSASLRHVSSRRCTPFRLMSAPTKTARKTSGGSVAGVKRSTSTPR